MRALPCPMTKRMESCTSQARRRPLAAAGLPEAIAGLMGAVVLALPTSAAHAQAAPSPARPLTIVSLDAASIAGLAPAAPNKARPAWRTTFGSERRSEPKTVLPTGPVDADVVLILGLTQLRPMRLVFPAKDWKLVVSRQMLAGDGPDGAVSGDGSVVERPVTAVAIRLREGLRVTAQEHLLALASPIADGLARPRAPAGTAVRIQAGRTALWAVSVDLNPLSCGPDEPQCKEPKVLADWRQQKLAGGEQMIIGGRVDIGGPPVLPPPPCPGLALLERRPGSDATARRVAALPEGDLGCIARVTVGDGE